MSHPVASDNEQSPPLRITPAVLALIWINIAITFLQYVSFWKVGDMVSTFGVEWSSLGSRWWTMLTYTLVHGSVWQLAATVYALVVFGPRLEQQWGARRFSRFYLLAALGGSAFYALFVHTGVLFGGSAAAFGVAGAYALLWPREELHLFGIVPMKAWRFAALLVTATIGLELYGLGSPAQLAHLGGLAVAWFYLRTPHSTSIEQLRQRVSQVPDGDDSPPRAIPRALPRSRERLDEADEIVAKSKAIAANRPPTQPQQNSSQPSLNQEAGPRDSKREEVNRVLDKISAEGLGSLSAEERKVLEEMSKKLRRPLD